MGETIIKVENALKLLIRVDPESETYRDFCVRFRTVSNMCHKKIKGF